MLNQCKAGYESKGFFGMDDRGNELQTYCPSLGDCTGATITVCVGEGQGETRHVTAEELNALLASGERVRLGECPSD